MSHYTRKTGYEKEVKNLIESLDRWNLDRSITAIDSFGSWRENSNYCARLVLNALNDNPDRDILRVDADAVFERYPSIFEKGDTTCDIAAHVHDFKYRKNELLGGTIFFRNTPQVRTLVDIWAYWSTNLRKTERNPDLLQELVASHSKKIKFKNLPDEYCTIFDKMSYVKEPVIVHHQASRRFKRMINREGRKRK